MLINNACVNGKPALAMTKHVHTVSRAHDWPSYACKDGTLYAHRMHQQMPHKTRFDILSRGQLVIPLMISITLSWRYIKGPAHTAIDCKE